MCSTIVIVLPVFTRVHNSKQVSIFRQKLNIMNATNKMTIAALIAAASLTACQSGGGENKDAANKQTEPMALSSSADSTTLPDTCLTCVPVDTANKMITSYINSLNGNSGNEYLYSLIVDADEMRDYLNANPSVKNVKLMFAHTLEYINSGHGGQNCGTKAGKLTVILAGYDATGNYVIGPNGVMDHAMPCPTSCPSVGTASSNTLPTN